MLALLNVALLFLQSLQVVCVSFKLVWWSRERHFHLRISRAGPLIFLDLSIAYPSPSLYLLSSFFFPKLDDRRRKNHSPLTTTPYIPPKISNHQYVRTGTKHQSINRQSKESWSESSQDGYSLESTMKSMSKIYPKH